MLALGDVADVLVHGGVREHDGERLVCGCYFLVE